MLDFFFRPVLLRVAHFQFLRCSADSCGRRNGEPESGAPPGFRLQPDSSALALDDFLAKRQTDASPGNFAPMQAFEHAEHAFGVLRFDTDSVVPHREQPPSRDLSAETWILGVSSPRYLIELEMRFWKSCISRTSSVTTVGSGSEVTMAPLCSMATWRLNSVLARTAPQSMEAKLFCSPLGNFPIGKQGLKQGLDPQSALHRIGDEPVRLFAQFSRILLPQQLGEVDHHAQGFLQVVRQRIGKMLEFGIGGVERFFGLLAVCCVLDRQKDGARLRIRIEDLARVEQHHLPSHVLEFVGHFKIPERRVRRENVLQQFAQFRNIPLSVPQVVDQAPLRSSGVARNVS